MNDAMTPTTEGELRDFIRGVRIFAAFLACTASYFLIRTALSLETFESIYRDMSGPHPVGGIAGYLTAWKIPVIIFSFLIPVSSLFSLVRLRSHTKFFLFQAALIVLILVAFHILIPALLEPLMGIVGEIEPA